MTDLTDVQIATMRRALSDNQSELFGDGELQMLFDEASGNLAQATANAIKWIMADSVKLQSYKTKTGELDSDAVFSRLKQLHDMYLEEASRTAQQVQIVGMMSTPRRRRDYPAGDPRNPVLPRRRR
jgi:hypothetical protein